MEHRVKVASHMDVVGNVVVEEAESLVAPQVGYIVGIPSQQIIHANYFASRLNEPVTNMAAQESRSAGYQYSLDGLVV